MNTATLTKRDLVEVGPDALPPPTADITVQHHAGGGVSQVNLPQVIEVAKFMAASQEGVPPHCRGNVGICLRVTFQAVEWQMSPFSVADMSYIVNGRLAYMSQLIHAVVEGRAPLQHRLDCDYSGEGPTRQCTVRGMFTTGDVREYTSPMFKDIKVKNSPLWTADLDQQLFYYSSRSWARKWCPDVLLGVYTKEELRESPMLGREDDAPEAGLHARLAKAAKSDEGHSPGHVESELAQVGVSDNAAKQPATSEPTEANKRTAGRAKGKDSSKTKEKPEAKPEAEAEAKAPAKETPPLPAPDKPPRTVEEWVKYVRAWIIAETNPDALATRWASERRLRNDLGVTSEDRAPVEKLKMDRVEELEKA